MANNNRFSKIIHPYVTTLSTLIPMDKNKCFLNIFFFNNKTRAITELK